MTVRTQLLRLVQQEDINFLLTNRIPRRLATQFIGWFSRIEQPLVRDMSIGLWRLFSDLDLREAKKTHFRSMHDCFTRELKRGPSGRQPDRYSGQPLRRHCGRLRRHCGHRTLSGQGLSLHAGGTVGDRTLVEAHRNGRYVTLRLTSSMYHRFHAPHDGHIERVIYISGDTWNVNPIALKRVERLFCKNERAVVETKLAANGQSVTLVAVAAILVASIRMHCLDAPLNLKHSGPNVFPRDAVFQKGDELGWFEHGSTIIVFAPEGFTLCDNIRDGVRVRMGEPLMRLP